VKRRNWLEDDENIEIYLVKLGFFFEKGIAVRKKRRIFAARSGRIKVRMICRGVEPGALSSGN
jgi:hypothetical protein